MKNKWNIITGFLSAYVRIDITAGIYVPKMENVASISRVKESETIFISPDRNFREPDRG